MHVPVYFERWEDSWPYQLEINGEIIFPDSWNDSNNISKITHKYQGKSVGLEEPGAVAIQAAFRRTFWADWWSVQ